MRRKAGEEILKKFYAREESSSRIPQFLEKEFHWRTGNVKVKGRWDRVDLLEKGAILVDFKATEVKDQKEADKKTRDSLQMDLYALSFEKTQEMPLKEIQLHFLGSDIIGRAQKTDTEFGHVLDKILEVEEGIHSQNFHAKPDWHHCNLCEFKIICPDSYAY